MFPLKTAVTTLLAIGLGAGGTVAVTAATASTTPPSSAMARINQTSPVTSVRDTNCVDRSTILAKDSTVGSMRLCSEQTLTVKGDTIEIAAVPVCQDGLSEYRQTANVRGREVYTLDETQLSDGAGTCAGIAVLQLVSGVPRYVVLYPPCPADPTKAWREYATKYSTRTSAIDRAANTPPACQ